MWSACACNLLVVVLDVCVCVCRVSDATSPSRPNRQRSTSSLSHVSMDSTAAVAAVLSADEHYAPPHSPTHGLREGQAPDALHSLDCALAARLSHALRVAMAAPHLHPFAMSHVGSTSRKLASARWQWPQQVRGTVSAVASCVLLCFRLSCSPGWHHPRCELVWFVCVLFLPPSCATSLHRTQKHHVSPRMFNRCQVCLCACCNCCSDCPRTWTRLPCCAKPGCWECSCRFSRGWRKTRSSAQCSRRLWSSFATCACTPRRTQASLPWWCGCNTR